MSSGGFVLLQKKVWAAGAFGLVALAFGVSVPFVERSIVRSKVGQILPLKSGSEIYNAWLDPGPDASELLQFWIFDVLNAEEIVTSGAQPVVAQRGPFTYHQKSLKVNVSFDSIDEDTVEYQQLGAYHFDPLLSAYSEDLIVTTLNFPVYVIEYLCRNQRLPGELLDIIVRLVENEHLFIKVAVKDLLWGYSDKFLTDFQQVLRIPQLAQLIKAFNVTVPNFESSFGYYYNRNESCNGVFKVYRGHKDITKFLTVASWNGLRSLDYWNSKECNMINGTDGSEYPPFIEKDSVRYLFSTDLCRSVPLVYYEDGFVQGVKTYDMRMPSTVFSYGSGADDNRCYCSGVNATCASDGVLDLGPCYYGAPVFISLPHFLHGDQSYVKALVGVDPHEDEHALRLLIEPNTGIVLDCAIRFQLNMKLTKVSNIKETRNLPDTLMFPLIWFNSTAVVTQARLDDFKSEFVVFLNICAVLPYVSIGLGLAFLIGSMLYGANRLRKHSRIMKNLLYPSKLDENSPLIKGYDVDSGATACQASQVAGDVTFNGRSVTQRLESAVH